MNSEKDENLLLEAIKEFEVHVMEAEKAFETHYNLSDSPLLAYTRKLIPKTGIIESKHARIEYNFHGRGCEVKLNSIIIDYDYHGDDFTYQGFGSWKLFEFVKQKVDKYEAILNEYYFFELVNNLETCGVISRINPPYATFRLNSC